MFIEPEGALPFTRMAIPCLVRVLLGMSWFREEYFVEY